MRNPHRVALIVAGALLVAAGVREGGARFGGAPQTPPQATASERDSSRRVVLVPVPPQANGEPRLEQDSQRAGSQPVEGATHEPSARRRTRRSGGSRVFLAGSDRSAGGTAVRAHGFDPIAPRPLDLWQVHPDTGRAALLAHGESGADGSVVFDRLLVSDDGTLLVAAPPGASPHGAEASAPLEIVPRDPPPPWATLDAALVLRVRAAPRSSALVAALDETPIARVPAPGTSPQRVALEPDDVRGGGVLVAQELADGRRSGWRFVSVPKP